MTYGCEALCATRGFVVIIHVILCCTSEDNTFVCVTKKATYGWEALRAIHGFVFIFYRTCYSVMYKRVQYLPMRNQHSAVTVTCGWVALCAIHSFVVIAYVILYRTSNEKTFGYVIVQHY